MSSPKDSLLAVMKAKAKGNFCTASVSPFNNSFWKVLLHKFCTCMAYFNTACEDVIAVIQLRPSSTLCYALQGIVVTLLSPGDKEFRTVPNFVKGETT
jgi:hypothetical protein